MAATDWNPLLRGEFDEPYWRDLQAFVAAERSAHAVYPPADQVFAALHLTPYADTKVMILGQDPYHGPKQAHGLCFSVQRGVRVPPSLINIHKELATDLEVPIPTHGNLETLGTPGRAAAQHHADRAGRAGRLAPGQGMGDVHRPA